MDLLKEGQRLSLFIEKGSNVVEMACTISAIYEDRLAIDLPSYFMRYIELLGVGSHLTVKIFSKLGTIDFNTVVISSPLEDEFSVELDVNALKLTPGEEIPIIKAIETLLIKKDDSVLNCRTFEISTEYLKLYCDVNLEQDANYEFELILPKNYGIISFRATVTDVDPIYDNEYTVSYTTMNEDNRQALLYYMYLYSNNAD